MEAFFRTMDRQMEQFGQTEELMELLARDYTLTPIFSHNAASTDSRFGCAILHFSM